MKTVFLLCTIIMIIMIAIYFLYTKNINSSVSVKEEEITEIMYVSGRPATVSDVEKGAAVFVLKDKNEIIIGKPYPIKIPQIVSFINEKTNKKEMGTLIQAEIGPNNEIIAGIKLEDGSFLASLMKELELTYPEKINFE